MPTKLNPNYTLSGRLTDQQGQVLPGLKVRAFDEDPKTPANPLGKEVITDSEGRYIIYFTENEFKLGNVESGGPDVFIRVYDGDELIVESPVKRNAKNRITINLQIEYVKSPRLILEGGVVLENSLPAKNLQLRLYRYSFGNSAPKVVAATTTNERGEYTLSIVMTGKSVSLEIRTIDAAGNEMSLSKLMHDLGGGGRAQVNLVAPANLQPLEPEYKRLMDDLKPYVGESERGSLADACENAVRQDLTFLNRNTGWDARLIALAAIAEKLKSDLEVTLSPEVLYGLFRAGLPTHKLLLAQVSPDIVGQALSEMRKTGIVGLSEQQLTEAKTQFEEFALKTKRALPIPGSRSTYDDLLSSKTLGLTPEESSKFAQIYFNHRGDAEQLWAKVANDDQLKSKINRLQLQSKLAFLTGYSSTMTDSLLSAEINDPVELVEMGFHDPGKWKTAINDAAIGKNIEPFELIPSTYKAARVEDRLEAYAQDMARKVRLSYPTLVVTRLVSDGYLSIAGLVSDGYQDKETKLDDIKVGVAGFLKEADSKGFKLGQTPVDIFIENNLNEFKDVTPEIKQAVRTLHRVFQITPSNDAMKVLLDKGLTSAKDVLSIPYDTFLTLYGNSFPSLEEARLLYRKAEQVGYVAFNLLTQVRLMASRTPMYGFSPSDQALQNRKNPLIKDIPTMETLFGSVDFCECEHCRSVLSPAAYLVDLLLFIDSDRANKQSKEHVESDSPYDVLIKRRGDIPNIQLTCENTNTVLPYIDVVNEIMEYYVVKGLVDLEAAHDTGDATTAELLAEPQNVSVAAYDQLQQERYPLNLPFDLSLETARSFCDYFETPLWKLLQCFRKADNLTEGTNIFIESLGISPAENNLVFANAGLSSDWPKLFGQQSSEKIAKIVKVTNSPTPPNSIVEVSNDDAGKFMKNDLVTFYNVSTQSFSEFKTEILLVEHDIKAPTIKITVKANLLVSKLSGNDLMVGLVFAELKSAKTLSRLLGVTYKELVKIIQTGFVNPNLAELVVLRKLGVTIQDVLFYKDYQYLLLETTLTKDEQKKLNEVNAFIKDRLDNLPSAFNASGFDAKGWLDSALKNGSYDKILVLADPDASCNFDQTTLRYANGRNADAAAYIKINLFVRLWRKLGWTIEETDRALQLFAPQFGSNGSYSLKTALIYLAHLKTLDERLKVGRQSRLKLLTLWSDIATTGKRSLYEQLFLTRNILKSDPIFDARLGNHLQYFDQTKYKPFYWGPDMDEDPASGKVALKNHNLAVQGALGLTADDISLILEDAGKSFETAELSLSILSLLYRYGLLAKALKLSVRELVILKQLSGLNPFTQPLHAHSLGTIEDDYPFSQTLRFVEIAEELKNSGLNIEDLDYLLRHRFDETGKYRANREGMLTLLKTLSDGICSIRAEHPVPDEPAALGEEALRQKLGLALPPDVVSLFLAMLNGTSEFTATKTDVTPDHELKPEWFADEPAIREISYNQTRQELKLTFKGVLFDKQKEDDQNEELITKEDLIARFAEKHTEESLRSVFVELLDSVKEKALEFFNTQLKKQQLPLDGEAGFLEESDYEELFLPLKPLIKILPSDTAQVIKEKLDANVAIEQKNQATLQSRRYRIAKAFLPYLQQRLIRQFIVQTMVAQTGADPGLVEGLLTDSRLLGGAQPLLQAFTSTAERGLTATYFFSPDRSGVKLITLIWGNTAADVSSKVSCPFKSTGPKTAILEGYLEVPKDGTYDFSVLLPKQTDAAELRIDDPAIQGQASNLTTIQGKTSDSEEEIGGAVFLAMGKRYLITLTIQSLHFANARLMVGGDGLPKDTLNSARVEGYLEVPTPGAYRYFIQVDEGAEAELRFDHLPDPLISYKKVGLELKSGLPYGFTLELGRLNGGEARLLVQGERVPKGSLSQLTLYPLTAIKCAEQAFVLLTKTLQLAQGLNLDHRELSYLVSHKDDVDIDLNKLPWEKPCRNAQQILEAIAKKKIEDDPNFTKDKAIEQARKDHPDLAKEADQVTDLFGQFQRLAGYARLKREIAGGTNDLIGIFEANQSAAPDKLEKLVYPLIAKLTRRDPGTVKATAIALMPNKEVPDFASEKPVQRLWQALQVVERFGVPVGSLVEWTGLVSGGTNRFQIASNLKEAIKARFEPETWQRVAQPIFDKLRQRQRDALVSYIMHQMSFERMEQLYEHFLIDPGMEPVVQTSRIRLAISSIQLFIQRCLLNLERDVPPNAINSKQWEWMKRYRVWEANRKIFLFPENWLEPEFRDDKTHLFNELESNLLQGDVSSDLVEDAFLNYLKKLDELARLDIVAMYQDDSTSPATLHVIGRTYSQPHKYFYRRYNNPNWTPWEPVTAEIEGDHLAPVVWRDRLYLFWVTFMVKPDENAEPSSMTDSIANSSLNKLFTSLKGVTNKKKLDIKLNWSEYVGGKWSTSESGGFVSFSEEVTSNFDQQQVFIYVVKEPSENEEERGIYIHLIEKGINQAGKRINQAFYVEGRNSIPIVISEADLPTASLYSENARATKYGGDSNLQVAIELNTGNGGKEISILKKCGNYTLLPCNNPLSTPVPEIASLAMPFFFQDNEHTFFIEPQLTLLTIPGHSGWLPGDWGNDVVWTPGGNQVTQSVPWTGSSWQNSISKESLLKINRVEDWLVNPQTGLMWEGEVIGSLGRGGLVVTTKAEAAGATVVGGQAGLLTGSTVPSGSVLISTEENSFEKAGLTANSSELILVGSGGSKAKKSGGIIRPGYNVNGIE